MDTQWGTPNKAGMQRPKMPALFSTGTIGNRVIWLSISTVPVVPSDFTGTI